MSTPRLTTLLLLGLIACTPTVQHAAAGTNAPTGESCVTSRDELSETERLWRAELAGAADLPLAAPACEDDARDDRTDFELDDIGKALFATLGVVFTIGMALAPYLLMI